MLRQTLQDSNTSIAQTPLNPNRNSRVSREPDRAATTTTAGGSERRNKPTNARQPTNAKQDREESLTKQTTQQRETTTTRPRTQTTPNTKHKWDNKIQESKKNTEKETNARRTQRYNITQTNDETNARKKRRTSENQGYTPPHTPRQIIHIHAQPQEVSATTAAPAGQRNDGPKWRQDRLQLPTHMNQNRQRETHHR